jgi:hypothetical protein
MVHPQISPISADFKLVILAQAGILIFHHEEHEVCEGERNVVEAIAVGWAMPTVL